MQKIRTRTKVLRIRRKDEQGASAVEFALVLPVFLLLVLGIIQYGTIFLLRNQLTESASDAARSAVTHSTTAGALAAAQAALSNDLIHNGTGLINSSGGCSQTGFTCTWTTIPGMTAGCMNVPSAQYECLQVSVSYDYGNHPMLALPFLPTPSSVTAASTVILGNPGLS